MKLNLQWLAFPVFGYAILRAAHSLYLLSGSWTVDVGWVYFAMGLQHAGYAVVATIFGFLVYFAFRETGITIGKL